MKEETFITKRKHSSLGTPRQRGVFKRPGFFRSLVYSSAIFWEFFRGFRFISHFGRAVSFFGSARQSLPERYYTDCEELAARLSTRGFAVISGGSGGIMEAANRGANRVDGESVGVNIDITTQEKSNRFLKHFRMFKYLFSRKTILSCASEVYIFFPGGFGTLDEVFEMLTLVQLDFVDKLPIVFYGKEYWDPLLSFIKNDLAEKYKTISKEDLDSFVVMDSVDEAEHYITSLELSESHSCRMRL